MKTTNSNPMRSQWHLMFRAILFLMMFGYGLSAYASNDKVSIDVDGIALENVLKSIEQQTKYRFIYSKETINPYEANQYVHLRCSYPFQASSFRSVITAIFSIFASSVILFKSTSPSFIQFR